MKFDQILTDLKNNVYYPVYFLMGEEPYFIDVISDYIEEHILPEQEKEFNQSVLYGRDTDVLSVVAQAKRYPMMANYQVVIVKEAQYLDKIDALEPYCATPLKSTILVICYKHKKYDKRKSLVKTIQKNGVVFESDKLYDNKIPDWIAKYVSDKGFAISPKAGALLADYLGNNLGKVSNEIEKLIISLDKGTEITTNIIEQNIGISKDYNVFELQNAIGEKNTVKANQIVFHFAANPKDNPFIMVISILGTYFQKLLIYHQLQDKSRNNVASALSVNPFFVNDYAKAAKNYPMKKIFRIIGYLRDYDLKAKGVNVGTVNEGGLLKELIYKVIHL